MASSNGGPAFPGADPKDFPGIQGGMTLRDYFAAAALQGIIFHSGVWSDPVDEGCQMLRARNAETAYSYADAMLAERNRDHAAQSGE